jgi:hypothetical protein
MDPMPSEKAKSRYLRDARAEGGCDQYDMDRCRLESNAQRAQQTKQCDRTGRRRMPMQAPEIDPTSAVSGLTLLLGGLAVASGRRKRAA